MLREAYWSWIKCWACIYSGSTVGNWTKGSWKQNRTFVNLYVALKSWKTHCDFILNQNPATCSFLFFVILYLNGFGFTEDHTELRTWYDYCEFVLVIGYTVQEFKVMSYLPTNRLHTIQQFVQHVYIDSLLVEQWFSMLLLVIQGATLWCDYSVNISEV